MKHFMHQAGRMPRFAVVLSIAFVFVLSALAAGQDAAMKDPAAPDAFAPDAPALGGASAEKFVASEARAVSGATVELRAEATVVGVEVTLRHVARWSDADAPAMTPLSDLIVGRFEGDVPFVSVSLDQVRHVLKDAGANLGQIRFAGSITCTVGRSDVKYDEGKALLAWIDAREGRAPAKAPTDIPAAALAPPPARDAAASLADASPATPRATGLEAAQAAAHTLGGDSELRTLRDLLLADAAVRLKLPAESLQITFNPADEKLLNLSQPQFRFNIDGRRVYALGAVAWDVTIVTDTVNKQMSIEANARAWQTQVLLVTPLAYHQVIRPDDVVEKRVLADRLPDDPLLTLSQCVGQETCRELKPGTVMTAPLISPATLARQGQLVTVLLSTGSIRIKTVARAMEAGSYGQTIRVKNDDTGEIYQLLLTGPQEGTVGTPNTEKPVASAGT